MKKSVVSFFLFGAILSAAPVNVTMVDAGNPVKAVNGVDVGPYDLTINGVKYQAMCMDDFLTSNVGSTWSANVTAVSGTSFSNTYLGQSNFPNDIGWLPPSYTDKQIYSMEAYLFNQLVQPNANRGNIQQAAWDIMDAGAYWGDSKNSSIMAVLNDALKNYSTFDTNGYQIVRDVNGSDCRNQEFMIHTSATPEPATFALMGGGLFAAGTLRFFRRKKQAEVKA
jgi:hypothetical protein